MTRGPFRLLSGGRIDREQPVSFLLDGQLMSGFRGDTLASAILANGVTLVGRSFKYHRPRGFLSAGVEEPNGLFTLGEGGSTDPNVAGTVTELVEGLKAQRQNAWPSVRFDLMAMNSLAAPLLSAGFYYKTFMGPTRRAWMFYEPLIRRAAGLGRAAYERDPDRYETRHAFADVLVVGGGPAGLSAALAAGQAGARVVLVEQDSLLGGNLLLEKNDGTAAAWIREMESELDSMSNVEVFRRTTAIGVYDNNMVALVERRGHLRPNPARGEAREVVTTLRARSIVFATGAAERPLVFTNNDRPGVMLASAARTYLNRFAVSCGKRAIVVTNNDSAYATAFDLAEHVVDVVIADTRRAIAPALRARASALDIKVVLGITDIDVRGGNSINGAIIASASKTLRLGCDLICMSGGWSPVVHLTSHTGIKPQFREDIAAFIPGASAQGQFVAGALTGTFATQAGVHEGLEAGRRAAAYSGHSRPIRDANASVLPASFVASASAMEPCWKLPKVRPAKAFVDFQNDVTVKDLMIAHQEGYVSVEHFKRYTTLGMGTDQGKTSNINALGIVAEMRGMPTRAAGTTTFRPPFTPTSIGSLAGRRVGRHFRPTRRSPLHQWHVTHGAEMTEAGLWMRAWWYRWAGDTVEDAYVAEMALVRQSVGLSDVSTLGKIDVQGPDAGEFVDRVYVNGFAKLPIGKARYGVMLNDDGAVLDDGTATRLSETHYFVTTTTAQAGEVMSWLEFLLQTACTDLKVHLTSVTDEWGAMVLAGPKARAALGLALPNHDIKLATLPYMGCLEVDIDGVPVRLIRLSFSGELSYEIYVPADYCVAIWEHFLESAAPLGIRPYGLESLASLRIEKGHVAGLELDHRTTLDDLGLGSMASTQKPYIGKELRQRPNLQAPERWSLVGIECSEVGKRLRGGSILFAGTDRVEGHGRGYITSVTWSAERERYIALGLYQGGLKNIGSDVVCAYPLKGEQTRARIVAPIFIDPQGTRLRV